MRRPPLPRRLRPRVPKVVRHDRKAALRVRKGAHPGRRVVRHVRRVEHDPVVRLVPNLHGQGHPVVRARVGVRARC